MHRTVINKIAFKIMGGKEISVEEAEVSGSSFVFLYIYIYLGVYIYIYIDVYLQFFSKRFIRKAIPDASLYNDLTLPLQFIFT